MKGALTFIAAVAFVAFIVVGTNLVWAQSDPMMGSWELNRAKSQFNPGPPLKLLAVKIGTADKGAVTVTSEGTTADGKRVYYVYTAPLDGKDASVTEVGLPDDADTVSCKHSGNILDASMKRDGKLVLTMKMEFSKDGKTDTLTEQGTDSDGKPIHDVIVLDKE